MLFTVKQLRKAGFVSGYSYLSMRLTAEKSIIDGKYLHDLYDSDKAINVLQCRINRYRVSLRHSQTTEKKMIALLESFKKAIKELERTDGGWKTKEAIAS